MRKQYIGVTYFGPFWCSHVHRISHLYRLVGLIFKGNAVKLGQQDPDEF